MGSRGKDADLGKEWGSRERIGKYGKDGDLWKGWGSRGKDGDLEERMGI